MHKCLSETRYRSQLKPVLFCFIAAGLLLLLFAIIHPVNFRLMLFQPIRDVIFFNKELQPFEHFYDIETTTPTPTRTVTLSEEETESYSVQLVLDLWIPDEPRAPTAILLHGSSPYGRKIGINRLLASRLQDAGWFVVTPDARGFGQSGTPDDIRDPDAWNITDDISKVIEYTMGLGMTARPLVLIGHSIGGNHILESLKDIENLDGVILKGPSRFAEPDDKYPSLWRRLRFSSDRQLGEIISADVLRNRMNKGDIKSFFASAKQSEKQPPMLLLDGDLEDKEEREVLEEVSNSTTLLVGYKTISGSGHYCGTYHLPFIDHLVFYRTKILDKCVCAMLKFMGRIIEVADK